jgi:xylose isomerase
MDKRYGSFNSELGQKFEKGELSLNDMHGYTHKNGEPSQISGKQEMFENLINQYI